MKKGLGRSARFARTRRLQASALRASTPPRLRGAPPRLSYADRAKGLRPWTPLGAAPPGPPWGLRPQTPGFPAGSRCAGSKEPLL